MWELEGKGELRRPGPKRSAIYLSAILVSGLLVATAFTAVSTSGPGRSSSNPVGTSNVRTSAPSPTATTVSSPVSLQPGGRVSMMPYAAATSPRTAGLPAQRTATPGRARPVGASTIAAHAPAGTAGGTPAGSPDPAGLSFPGGYYLQEGFTFENAAPLGDLPSLSVQFTVPANPAGAGVGSELNGLTSTGDWVQAVVVSGHGVWSACSTVQWAFEIWDAAGDSVDLDCIDNGAPAVGDSVVLTMSLNCASGGTGSICLAFVDLTDPSQSGLITVDQPDPVASAFQLLSEPSNSQQYFTGPMTETFQAALLGSANSCTDYTVPTVIYNFTGPGQILTAVMSWADEIFLTVGGPQSCTLFQALSPTTTVLFPSVLTDFVQTSGTLHGYGPHWEGVQNWTAVSGLADMTRLETDAVWLSMGIIGTLPGAAPDVGQPQQITGGVLGGVPNVFCQWVLNGAEVPGVTTCNSWSFTVPGPGTNTVQGEAIDGVENIVDTEVEGVYAYAAPSVTLTASASTLFMNNPVTFSADVTGGAPGGFVYDWRGLPESCPWTSSSASVTCTPTQPITITAQVTVTDTNEATATSNPVTVVVENPCVTVSPLEQHCPTLQFVGNGAWNVTLFCLACDFVEALSPSNSSVPLNGSGPATVEYTVPNGTYQYAIVGPPGYGLENLPPVGNLTVGASNLSVRLVFQHHLTSRIEFSEAGLAAGTRWCVRVVWTSCSTSRSLSVSNLAPGVYPYEISPVAGYGGRTTLAGHLENASGFVSLSRTGVVITTKFTEATYLMTFREMGLGNGTRWSVELSGSVHGRPVHETRASKVGTIGFEVPNGTFNYTVKPVQGYLGSAIGSVVVFNGASVVVVVGFLREPRGDVPLETPATVGVIVSPAPVPSFTTAWRDPDEPPR